MNTQTEAVAIGPAASMREAFWALKQRRIRVSPCHSTRASSLGHECERFLYYEQTAWEQRAPHSATSQAIFDLGNHLEDFVLRELDESGVRVVQTARDYADRRYNLTGHIDAKVIPPGWTGAPIPAEVKGLNPYTAESIRSADDIRNSKSAWVRKYFAQLQVYLLLDNAELGVFVLLNKVSGQIEFHECHLDYEYAEGLLKKAERLAAAVRENAAPPRFATDECARCPFVAICQPDIEFGQGVEFFDDAEAIALLQRREELRDAANEFERVDKELKKSLPQKEGELLVGDFIAKSKVVERKPYAVKAGSYLMWSFKPLKKESK